MKNYSPCTIVATDCGSTTTKAILFEQAGDGHWRQTYRGEAPTTVEKPVADVTIGVMNACLELQEISGRQILDHSIYNDTSDQNPPKSQGEEQEIPLEQEQKHGQEQKCECKNPFLFKTSPDDPNGIDLYISTSSAGGGLQMIVAGVAQSITATSAERAALGAGAIVMDTIALDDGRETEKRIEKIRHLRPDIILIAGGTDGGTATHPLELAETMLQANPAPRFGETLKLTIIYAANKDTEKAAAEILSQKFDFTAVENLRPSLDTENLAPARSAIHDLFLKHVMSHAPGYKKLLTFTPHPIIPTPVAFGNMIQNVADASGKPVIAVDIGGATTDIFSAFSQNSTDTSANNALILNRTVSANLGMSYSMANVILETGIQNVKRWLPFDIADEELEDRFRNKMVRPTTIPQSMESLLLEQAICREALRLAFAHHKKLVIGLKGVKNNSSFTNWFKNNRSDEIIDMLKLDLLLGSGGVLSHAPDRRSAAMMLIDALQPVGITKLAVDSIFMIPHLGVLSQVNLDAALEIFERDCIIKLGTVIAPQGQIKLNRPAFEVEIGNTTHVVPGGELIVLPFEEGRQEQVIITPRNSGLNFGNGYGKRVTAMVHGGAAGIVLDARGRDIIFATQENERIEQVKSWHDSIHTRANS